MFSQTSKTPRIEPKGLYYYGDGTGRDGYVLKFNGGLFSSNMINKLKPRPQNSYENFHTTTSQLRRSNPSGKEISVQHYFSDGSGRDSYVLINDGGRTVNYNMAKKSDNIFASQLRSYPKLPSMSTDNSSLRLIGPYGYRSPKQIQENRMKYMQQTSTSARLSQNKPVIQPPQLDFTPQTTNRKFKIKKYGLNPSRSLQIRNNSTSDCIPNKQQLEQEYDDIKPIQSTQVSPAAAQRGGASKKVRSFHRLDDEIANEYNLGQAQKHSQSLQYPQKNGQRYQGRLATQDYNQDSSLLGAAEQQAHLNTQQY